MWCLCLTRSEDCSNDKNTSEELIRPEWRIQQGHHVLRYEQEITPLALMECHVPPGTLECHVPWHLNQFTLMLTLWAKFTHLQICFNGGVGITYLYRWCSPSHVEVFHLRKSAPGHLSHLLSQTQHTWCPPLVYGQSLPSSMVGLHSLIAAQSLCWQHRQSHVRWSATWKMLYIFVLLSVKEINFCMTSDVRHWAANLCQLMECWWLTAVNLPWTPH